MANGDGNGWGALANRIGTWAVLVGMAIYVYDIGSWVGAADQKFESAAKVEETQDDIKRRLTTVESAVGSLEKSQDRRFDEQNKKIDKIISSIEKLADEVKESNRE